LIAQPARAPGTRPGKLQLIQPNLDRGRIGQRRSAVVRKECALTRLPVLFVEDGNGLLPGGLLGIVDLTQVEDVTLHHTATDAAALDDGPGAMLLAVLASGAALEKHVASMKEIGSEERGWVATTRGFGTGPNRKPSKSASSPPPARENF